MGAAEAEAELIEFEKGLAARLRRESAFEGCKHRGQLRAVAKTIEELGMWWRVVNVQLGVQEAAARLHCCRQTALVAGGCCNGARHTVADESSHATTRTGGGGWLVD